MKSNVLSFAGLTIHTFFYDNLFLRVQRTRSEIVITTQTEKTLYCLLPLDHSFVVRWDFDLTSQKLLFHMTSFRHDIARMITRFFRFVVVSARRQVREPRVQLF